MRTPVLIVSGFLGSGKTTLVRNLLQQSQAAGIRVAVISNEFGALGIDEALLGGGAEEFVELAGGCVCCQLSDALVETLVRLHENVRPDRIIIETSGVALPFETQLHLYRPAVRSWIGDEACVVVVDATGSAFDGFIDPTGEAGANETFIQQVQSADLIVLSKVDRADPTPMLARLAVLAPDTAVLPAIGGDLPIAVLFPTGPDVGGPLSPQLREASQASLAERTAAARHHHHHEAYTSEELTIPDGLSPDEVESQLGALGALRVKGFVRTSAGVRIVQGVGRRLELSPPGPLHVDERLIGRVVIIRRGSGEHSHEDHVHGT